MIRGRECEHLTTRQRTYIRSSHSGEQYLARLYGISVATVRKVRSTAQPEHPARIAAVVRRETSEPLHTLDGTTLPVPIDYRDR